MRGALHLLPLCVSADDAPDADPHETLHPIAATARADAPPLDAAMTHRLTSILASVHSDIVYVTACAVYACIEPWLLLYHILISRVTVLH